MKVVLRKHPDTSPDASPDDRPADTDTNSESDPDPDPKRIVRYGVGDFDTSGNTVTLFYPQAIRGHSEAPPEEHITGDCEIVSAVDSTIGSRDPTYLREDLQSEHRRADDLHDYRPNPPAVDPQQPGGTTQ